MRKAQIFIVDDHPLVRMGLKEIIQNGLGMHVCGEAENATQTLAKLRKLDPDLAIVDISLGGRSGLEIIKEIRQAGLTTKVLVCSMHDDELFAERSLRAGAQGYVCKREPPNTFKRAVESVLEGKVFLSEKISQRIFRRIGPGENHHEKSRIETLSDRELEVYEWIGRGLSTREIADKLHLSVKTIESHRENIKHKLGLKGSLEIARSALLWLLQKDPSVAKPHAD